jgi:microcystin degradation protein MlrC
MRILLLECMQEVSSFNPLLSHHEDFAIASGEAVLRQRGLNTAVGGALKVFEGEADVEVVPAMSARAGSAGLLAAEDWQRLRDELLVAARVHEGTVDALYVSLHGAMGAVGETDPEGSLLDGLREIFAPLPLVISLDLHGILTDRMLRAIDGLAIYRTYPHVDFADKGRRAAEQLLEIVRRSLHPVIARVTVPMLARGDECITKTGWYGDVLREAQLGERHAGVLAAGVMIGNPFTDAPELCTQAIVVAEQDVAWATGLARELAERMWAGRARLTGKLVSVDKAIALAGAIDGPVLFTDAADATSSGASGDSNVLISALRDASFPKRVLAQIVDPEAAQAAHAAGVGAEIDVTLGGAHDKRFVPMRVRATVESLSRGRSRLETMRLALDAGPTAVLIFDNFTVVVMTRSVMLFDRAMYFSNGLDPHDYDLIVVKSPHTEFHMYDQWVEKNFNVDAPGATSANVASLCHVLCARPIYPLEPDTEFVPKPVIYHTGRTAA